MRKAVMIAASVLLLVEAVAIAAVNWILGIVVDKQDMSLAGSDPGITQVGAWTAGGVLAVALLVVAVLVFLTGLRDRAPGRVTRILVIVAAVFNGVLGILAVSMIGWPFFVFAMIELGLLVLGLLIEDEPAEPAGKAEQPDETPPAAPTPA